VIVALVDGGCVLLSVDGCVVSCVVCGPVVVAFTAPVGVIRNPKAPSVATAWGSIESSVRVVAVRRR
jgi:hypothetical protein